MRVGLTLFFLVQFGILDIKAESEEQLRRTGVEYCIVRPCGLNDDWPSGSRPLVSQGDVAVGRINRKDVAKMLVDVLTTPQATGKTFEMVGLAGYPPPSSSTGIGKLLETLKTDKQSIETFLGGEKKYQAVIKQFPEDEEMEKKRTFITNLQTLVN